MTLKNLNESAYMYNDEDSHLNPDGSKKPWKHKRSEEDVDKLFEIDKLEKKLTKLEKQLKSLKIKINRTKNESQKYVLVNDRQNPLIAKIQNLKKEIAQLK